MFANKDVFGLMPKRDNRPVPAHLVKAPSSRDVYFISKCEELIAQYRTARIFLQQYKFETWDRWLKDIPSENEEAKFYAKTIQQIACYEAALVFYNIVVDLSWVLCYVSFEFSLARKGDCEGKRIVFGEIGSIEESMELLRIAEKNVICPSAEETPFIYLKHQYPDSAKALDLVTDFWNTFSSSNIRSLYNYIKHKGKPKYDELNKINHSPPWMFLGVNKEGHASQSLVSPTDLLKKCSFIDGVDELIQFDDTQLYPYLKALFEELYAHVNPSPWVSRSVNL